MLRQLNELGQQSWYVGDVSRASAETTVRSCGHDGAFVVRQSRKGGVSNPLTLTLLYATNVYNLHIRLRDDEKFAIGKEKPGEIVSLYVTGVNMLVFFSTCALLWPTTVTVFQAHMIQRKRKIAEDPKCCNHYIGLL